MIGLAILTDLPCKLEALWYTHQKQAFKDRCRGNNDMGVQYVLHMHMYIW